MLKSELKDIFLKIPFIIASQKINHQNKFKEMKKHLNKTMKIKFN